MVRAVQAEEAPLFEDLGFPISHAVVHDDTVYASGFLGLDPDSLEPVEGGVQAETRQSLENIGAILEAAGSSLDNAMKVVIYHTDMDDVMASMEVYREYVSEPYPARSTVGVNELPLGATIEIDVTAHL